MTSNIAISLVVVIGFQFAIFGRQGVPGRRVGGGTRHDIQLPMEHAKQPPPHRCFTA